MRRSSTLTLGPLVAVMYFTVSGGPFGLEGLVGSVGPGVALLLLVLTPLVFSVPETLLIGELASMLPAEGGYYVWVKRAFGRFWGFWNGWLSWVYSLIDMAIYPVLFLQYLRFFLPGLGRFEAWVVALAVIWGATWLNLRGTRVVGTASGWFVGLVLAPFGVLAAAGDGGLSADGPARAGAHGLDDVDGWGVASDRGRRGRSLARGLDRRCGARERVRVVQRAAARVLTHPAGAGAGRPAAPGARGHRRTGHAQERGARLGAGVLRVCSDPVRRPAGRWRAAVERGAGARGRGAAAAAP